MASFLPVDPEPTNAIDLNDGAHLRFCLLVTMAIRVRDKRLDGTRRMRRPEQKLPSGKQSWKRVFWPRVVRGPEGHGKRVEIRIPGEAWMRWWWRRAMS